MFNYFLAPAMGKDVFEKIKEDRRKKLAADMFDMQMAFQDISHSLERQIERANRYPFKPINFEEYITVIE